MASRAEELIACLEAEIVKRDARIAELEAPMLAWAELDYTKHTRRSLMCYIGQQNFRITAQENKLAALNEQQRGVVVLPERKPWRTLGQATQVKAEGWNECLDAIARLNQPGDGVNWKAVAGEQKTVIEGLQARLNQPCECVAVPRELANRIFEIIVGEGFHEEGELGAIIDDSKARALLYRHGKENA